VIGVYLVGKKQRGEKNSCSKDCSWKDKWPALKYYSFAFPPNPFALSSGRKLGPVTLAYEEYGSLNRKGDNCILICHALTGSSHVASHGLEGEEEGWWEPLIGPGKAIDTDKFYVVCINVLGGCYGSTGPASPCPQHGTKPYALSFPVVTIRDIVRSQRVLLVKLGVKKLAAVIGGSMGGMQALEWAVTYPDMVETSFCLAASGRFSPIGIAYNLVGRRAIMNDPNWRRGNYYGKSFPSQGLALARIIGTITYKSNESFMRRFGRRLQNQQPEAYYDLLEPFAVESYLDYQGEKLVKRFDANSYLYLSKAMDLHDLGRGYHSYEDALARIKARVFLLGISSDILFPTTEVRGMAVELRRQGVAASYTELKSPHGHDAFLIEFEWLDEYLRKSFQSAGIIPLASGSG